MVETQEPVRRGHEAYRQQYVRCGRPTCTCRTGEGHGPYWYGIWREGKRVRTRYIGRVLPPEIVAVRAAEAAERAAGQVV